MSVQQNSWDIGSGCQKLAEQKVQGGTDPAAAIGVYEVC